MTNHELAQPASFTMPPMNTKQIRIAVIEPVGGHGGMNHYDASLCSSLVTEGVSPILYTCDLTRIAESQFEVRLPFVGVFGADPAWKRGLRFLRGSVFAFFHAKYVGCRAAHFHFFNVGTLQFFHIVFARGLGLRVVITAHDVEAFKEGLSIDRFVRWSYCMAHAVIAHNEITRTELVEEIGVRDDKIHVIPHGNYADLAKSAIDRTGARRHLKLENDEIAIVFFGHIKEVKGLDILLRAMPDVIRSTRRRVRLIIAGRLWQHGFERYQQLIDSLGLEKNVSLHLRYIPDEELPSFYRGADLMVLPYRRIYQSGVALMALTLETPIIASDVPGMKEMIDHLQTGILFESENPNDLASKMLWAIEHPEALSTIVKNGRELMQRKYPWHLVGEKTAALYRSL